MRKHEGVYFGLLAIGAGIGWIFMMLSSAWQTAPWYYAIPLVFLLITGGMVFTACVLYAMQEIGRLLEQKMDEKIWRRKRQKEIVKKARRRNRLAEKKLVN